MFKDLCTDVKLLIPVGILSALIAVVLYDLITGIDPPRSSYLATVRGLYARISAGHPLASNPQTAIPLARLRGSSRRKSVQVLPTPVELPVLAPF